MDDVKLETDVLVVGAGVAGLRCALEAGKAGLRVLVATREPVISAGTSNAHVAEMAGFNAPEENGQIESFYEDICNAGQGMANPRLARIVAGNAREILQEMIDWGVPFEKTPEGSLYRYKGCFSTVKRTHVVKGHGNVMTKALRTQIEKLSEVKFVHVTILSLASNNGRCIGVHGINGKGERFDIYAKATVFAVGGCGEAFERHFAPNDVTGSGYAMAYEAGAALENLEFMQVGIGFSYPVINIFNGYIWQGHPALTDCNGNDIFVNRLPQGLSYEKVENDHIWHFPFSTSDQSKWLEIAVNDVASSSCSTNHHGVICDLRKMTNTFVGSLNDESGISHMWPLARDYMKERGVDLLKEPVEIACFQHAMNGGIRINEHGESTLPGLFAIGECAGGPHGADRLGGNMFVTSLVFGREVGRYLAQTCRTRMLVEKEDEESLQRKDSAFVKACGCIDYQKWLSTLQQKTQSLLLVKRTGAGLSEMIRFDKQLLDAVSASEHKQGVPDLHAFDLWSMAMTTLLIARSALQRKESRGSHFRADYPEKDKRYAQVIVQKKGQDGND